MGLADYFGNKRKDTSLINAIKASNLAGLRNLIKEKVDINKSGKNRNTPLHYATTLEDSSFVNELLAAGADSFKVNEKGETALHYALKFNKKQPNIQVIRKLIEFSKTFNKLDNDYYSPLYLLLSHSLINNFCENLKDIFSKSNDQIEGNKTKILSAGKTLLHSAASNPIISKETFKIILDECNLDINLVSPISARLLSSDFASKSKRIEKLVCKGYSRNFTSKENLQALASNGVITEAQRKAGDNYREKLLKKSESFVEQIKQEKSQIKEKQNTLQKS